MPGGIGRFFLHDTVLRCCLPVNGICIISREIGIKFFPR
jgi:hypothetical protein